MSRDVPSLDPGDDVTLRHSHNDFSVQIHFSLRGRIHETGEEFVDLWTGEGWVLDIQVNGSVKSGYDYDYPDFVPREDALREAMRKQ